MRLPRTIVLVALATSLVACRSPEGPRAALGAGTATSLDAADDVAARRTLIEFFDAYAHEPAQAAQLLELSGTQRLKDWAQWTQVSMVADAGAVDGSITGALELSSVGGPLAARIPGQPKVDAVVVDLRADATFTLDPAGDTGSVDAVRSLDGPALLIRDSGGAWRVADFVLDGIRLSSLHQLATSTSWTQAGPAASVRLISADLGDRWQFDLVLRGLDPETALTQRDITLVASDGSTLATASFMYPVRLPEDQVGLIARFDPQADLKHMHLRIEFHLHRRSYPVRFELETFRIPTASTSG